MGFSFGKCQSFYSVLKNGTEHTSEGNFFTDEFVKKGDIIIKLELPQEAFMSVLKMD